MAALGAGALHKAVSQELPQLLGIELLYGGLLDEAFLVQALEDVLEQGVPYISQHNRISMLLLNFQTLTTSNSLATEARREDWRSAFKVKQIGLSPGKSLSAAR